MHLTLSPQMGLPGQSETTIAVDGDTLILDGTPYDLSPVPEGGDGEWPDSPLIGRIRRVGGVIHATVLVWLGDTAASDQPGSPWVTPDAQGAVAIPAARLPAETAPEETA